MTQIPNQTLLSAKKSIPVVLVTGFLGAGKTTFLNYLLTNSVGEKIAVVVNEFGEIGVDQNLIAGEHERIVELTNGCLCCSVRGDLISTLIELWNENEEGVVSHIDRVVIETTGLADPVPLLQTFMSVPDIAARYKLESVVTLVDAMHFKEQRTYLPLAEEQVACADIIVLNKIDRMPKEAVERLKGELCEISPLASIYLTEKGEVPLAQLFAKKPITPTRPMKHQHHESDERHLDRISTLVLSTANQLAKNHFFSWLEHLLQETGPDMLRFKGRIHFENEERPSLLQGVHREYIVSDYPERNDAIGTELVFIGHDLDRDSLLRSWQALLSKE